MIGEAQPPPAETAGPPVGPKKSAEASFTCSQCHHLQRNGIFEYLQNGDELSADILCEHCRFRFSRLGHSDTFFSMSSQKTDGEMKDYYNENPMSRRKYEDPTPAVSVKANASEGGPVSSNPSHQGILVSTSASPSSRLSPRSHTPSHDHDSPVQGSIPANEYLEPTNLQSASRDIPRNLEPATKQLSQRQRMSRIVRGLMKKRFRLSKRPRTENTDHDQRAMDASTNSKLQTWRKWLSLHHRKPKDPPAVSVAQQGGDISLGPAQALSTNVSPPRIYESPQDDAAMEQQTANVDNDEPMSEEDRLSARRDALTAAAKAYGIPVITIPLHRFQALADHLPRGDGRTSSDSSYQAALLMAINGAGDDLAYPPGSLNVSEWGSPNGSRFQLDGMNSTHESAPSLPDSRRHSGETATSATLLNSVSSQRGSSRGRTRHTHRRSNTLGRSPLSSSPENRPSSAGESSSGWTASSRGLPLTLDTNHVATNGDATTETDTDGGEPTPRVGRQGIPIDRLAGPRQSISSILDEAEQQHHAQDPTGGSD